jgi:type II secretory pathway component PulF
LDRGLALGEAARQAQLPVLMSGLLGTAHAPPDVVAVLRFLARYYAARFSRVVVLLREAAVPVLALGAGGGGVVATIALAVFVPIVRLIDTVSVYPLPL